MTKPIDAIDLPSIPPAVTQQWLRDYLSQLQAAVQFFADNVVQTVNPGALPYYTLAVNQQITSGAIGIVETFTVPLTTAAVYGVFVTPNWMTSISVAPTSISSFQINFSTAAPGVVGTSSAQISFVVWLKTFGP